MNELDLVRDFRRLVPEPDEATRVAVRTAALRPLKHRQRRPRWLPAVVAVIIGGAISTSALAVSGRLGNLFEGSPVPTEQLAPTDRFVLSASDVDRPRVQLIASRAGRSFYVIHRENGGPCFASGPANQPVRLGTTMCPKPGTALSFPSAGQPILDHSSYAVAADSPVSQIEYLAGFAADPVARVAVIDLRGEVAASTAVVDNVYVAEIAPTPITELVAFDRAGRVLFRQCMQPDGCPSD